MSLAVLRSRALAGMAAPEVTVEVHIAAGLPSFTLVGLPDTEVKEARDRVRAALQNCRFDFPQKRITVNLAPADLPKESGRFDLPIALGILIASGQLHARNIEDYEFAGELALGGELRGIRGALAMCAAVAGEGRCFVLPQANAEEAGLVNKLDILPASSLLEVCAHLSGQQPLPLQESRIQGASAKYPDLSEVRGQSAAKRALEVAAAGGHSLLMSGPPGAGKSMLAQRFPGLLPEMDDTEALESAAIHSLAGTFSTAHWRQRPFRSPHHSASAPALVGGGSIPRPGEISLAHHGVLFLDELPEFDRRVLEALREPLESGTIHIARAGQRASFPARFQLVAAMNPCPCGHLGQARCRCTPDQVARYRSKLSGPLLDRIDLLLDISAITEAEVSGRSSGDTSAIVRARVSAARERQVARQGKANALLSPDEIEQHCTVDAAGEQLLKRAFSQLDLSARGYHRVLKVARSIADLADSAGISGAHIAEAIQYRRGAAHQ
ncbi:MAG: YifB family Mg chelatase-like AAA ATPase [Rhodocyclaceae bacterium]|nr:YifB family Mg chelatase-like AAA ATPase [Rhodocyclaceae bacterium]